MVQLPTVSLGAGVGEHCALSAEHWLSEREPFEGLHTGGAGS